MIHVDPQPKPADFDDKVRQPGLQALVDNLRPLPPYWRRCLKDLHVAYRGVCAYVSIYIDKATGARTVEHYVAKSSDPSLAYEWSNYRLACSLVNSRKGVFDDILDPFEIDDGWFVLEFSFLQVSPNSSLEPASKMQVQKTIDRLRLNNIECREARAEYYRAYFRKEISFSYLKRKCPFVAKEMRRQGLVRASDL